MQIQVRRAENKGDFRQRLEDASPLLTCASQNLHVSISISEVSRLSPRRARCVAADLMAEAVLLSSLPLLLSASVSTVVGAEADGKGGQKTIPAILMEVISQE